MQTFREFFTQRHGVWPYFCSERMEDAFQRLAETQADYIDEIVAPAALMAANPLMVAQAGFTEPFDLRPGGVVHIPDKPMGLTSDAGD